MERDAGGKAAAGHDVPGLRAWEPWSLSLSQRKPWSPWPCGSPGAPGPAAGRCPGQTCQCFQGKQVEKRCLFQQHNTVHEQTH